MQLDWTISMLKKIERKRKENRRTAALSCKFSEDPHPFSHNTMSDVCGVIFWASGSLINMSYVFILFTHTHTHTRMQAHTRVRAHTHTHTHTYTHRRERERERLIFIRLAGKDRLKDSHKCWTSLFLDEIGTIHMRVICPLISHLQLTSLPARLIKIWSQKWNRYCPNNISHYKSMGALCCHGNYTKRQFSIILAVLNPSTQATFQPN